VDGSWGGWLSEEPAFVTLPSRRWSGKRSEGGSESREVEPRISRIGRMKATIPIEDAEADAGQ